MLAEVGVKEGKTFLNGVAAAALVGVLVAVPFAAFPLLPLLVASTVAIRRRLGWGAGAAAWIAYIVCAFVSRDPLTLTAAFAGGACFTALAVLRERAALTQGAAAMLSAAAAAAITLAVVSLAAGKGLGELGGEYAAAHAGRPLLRLAADKIYAALPSALPKTDPGYAEAARKALIAAAETECNDYGLYHALGYPAFAALAAWFLDTAARGRGRTLKDVRIPRRYLLYVFLPVAAFSLLGINARFLPLTAAVFNLAVTAPGAACGATLLLYAADKFRGRARKPALAAAIVLCAAGYAFGWGRMIFSLVGFADILVPMRKWIDFAAD